jgi:coenzyme F420-reducing hydrogenase gamma subunit
VWKFSSCDGCQLTLLDLEDDLLALARAVDIVHFAEATTASVDGPYDVSLVEGSVSTQAEIDKIHRIRESSRTLVAIGACAIAGGIQALRNTADVAAFSAAVYPHPEYVATLATSTPASSHVKVDLELAGCPISKTQLLEVLGALLSGRKPQIPTYSVCVECKARGTSCVMVAEGIPCLGPVTRAGCGAICPAYRRGCYGCFGPAETVNAEALANWWEGLGVPTNRLVESLRTFNTAAPGFADAAAQLEQKAQDA